MNRISITLLASFLLTLAATPAHSYPNFISYGYQSCLSCHYNPYGNGPLTDYGRSVGATVISDRIFSSEKTTEEDIANRSDFYMGLAKKKTRFRPHISYRGLYLQRNVDKRDSQNDYITMDASAGGAMTWLDDKLIAVGHVSYAPVPLTMQGTGEKVEEYRSREHYIGYRVEKDLGIYIGMMDKVFGIRVPDHSAYSRRITGNNQNDQVHGALAHYSVEPFEIGVHVFVGNLVQDSELRQRGGTIQVEYALGEYSRVGFSHMTSFSDYQDISAQALHLRTGAGKGNSVMLELGRVTREIKNLGSTEEMYLFMQNHLNFRRGLYGLATFETLQADLNSQNYSVRFGPGLQWFPFQRFEYRIDYYNTKNYGESGTSDTWYLTNQVHLWF